MPPSQDAGQDAGPNDAGGSPDAGDAGDASARSWRPVESAPERVDTLIGPHASHLPSGVRVYGTDLGLTYEHDGQLFMLFGDTWPDHEYICNNFPDNDDAVATLPLSFSAGTPQPSFVTRPDSLDFSPIQLLRGSTSLNLGFGQAPLAAFADGERGFGIFTRVVPRACDDAGACPGSDGFYCSPNLGVCGPVLTAMTLVCDRETHAGCMPGQQCTGATRLCVDMTSPHWDGSIAGELASVVQEIEIAAQRASSPEVFDSVLTWETNKFSNPTARTVARFSGSSDGNDYGPGHGELLVWGRPGLFGEHGREARLYLMRHALPFPQGEQGALRFAPRYFAGTDPYTGEPTWSELDSDAQPLALDGELFGDPHEELQIAGTMTISWLGAPIDRWVMLYGGDFPDFLLRDAAHARLRSAIMLRFADHPWGPWSPPVPHLSPGLPSRAGDPYGPGGFLYHPACVDAAELECARSDPHRPHETVLPGCPVSLPEFDPGRLYGVNVIDAYTGPSDDGGLDMLWTVSTWNPYTVQLMKTRIHPAGGAAQPPADEVANARALRRMSDWRSLPVLPDDPETYVQQTSSDRGTEDTTFPLSGNGNRDFNNFLCASDDAQMGFFQFAPFHFDQPACEESYVKGAVLGRFEGSGRLARIWIGMASLLFGPADDEILRIYVDDDPTPLVEVPLADALDGSAGEIFAPPFGAGSPRRLAWYYPVAFDRKLIVALDRLGDFDEYFYHCDVALDSTQVTPGQPPSTRLPERDRVIAQLTALYDPAGATELLAPYESHAIAPGAQHTLRHEGPATIHQLRLRVPVTYLPNLSDVHVEVRWDGADEPAIDIPLLELLAADRVPPERSSLALTSFVEVNQQMLALKLPMPFATEAEWTFHNRGGAEVAFDLAMLGERAVPDSRFGYLHVRRSEALTSTAEASYVGAEISGRGRLVGLCGLTEGFPDITGGFQYDPLNLLEGDVQVVVDGELALDGTGTEEYADDVFYFTDAPHASPFVQAWGIIRNEQLTPPGSASFCRWHVLGSELDFESSLELRFELGGSGNPDIVSRHRAVAYYYLAP